MAEKKPTEKVEEVKKPITEKTGMKAEKKAEKSKQGLWAKIKSLFGK